METAPKSCFEGSKRVVGTFWFNEMVFRKAGDRIGGHDHRSDHLSFLYKGSVKSVVDGVEEVFVAPYRFLIKKGTLHEFTALEDDTRMDCIFPLRDCVTGQLTEEWDGSELPYE